LLIFGFAIISVATSYFTSRFAVSKNIERLTRKEMVADLVHLQGVIQLLLRTDNPNEAKSIVSSYDPQTKHAILFFTDPQGRILSSTQLENIGRNWNEINEPIDPHQVERIMLTRTLGVQLSQDQKTIYGYVAICVPSKLGALQPTECGFLYYSRDLTRRKQTDLVAFRNQAVREAVWLGLLSILLWLILHFTITRRIGQINSVASRFGQGDLDSRNQLTGNDELAKISKTLNSMYDTIENEHNELLRSEAEIKAIIETAVDGIITIDTSGIMRSLNPAVEHIFGYQKEQLIGQNVKILMPENYASEHDGYLNNYINTGEKKIIGIGREVQGLRSDGTTFPLDLSVSEIVGFEERKFVGVVRDISDRKRAEDTLKLREEHLRLTFDNAPSGIVTSHTDWRYLTANSAYKEMTGYSDSELMNLRITDTIHPEDRNICLDLANQTKSGELKNPTVSLRWVSKSKEVMYGNLHVGLIHAEYDTPASFVVQFQNLTKRINAENEARELRDRLAHVGRISSMGEMAAGIAHEINQPLTAIASYTEACQRLLKSGKADSNELLDAMERTSAQAHRAGEVIRRMRGFVKQRSTKREELDINALVRDIVKFAKMDLPIQGSSIKINLKSNLPAIIADSFQVQQVILNLIRNAADSMQDNEKDKTVVIQTEFLPPSQIQISVTDRGHGINDENKKKIFSPFFSTKKSGMGIGLAICRTVVESHHGELSFENNPTGGTTFNLILPIDSEV